MNDILILPSELRKAGYELLSHAKRIDEALQKIDMEMNSLRDDHFLGNRASTLQAHYAARKHALLLARNLILDFSTDLTHIAERFEQADAGTKGIDHAGGASVIHASVYPIFIRPGLESSPEMTKVTQMEEKYGWYLRKYADASGVPYQLLLRVIVKEQLEYGLVDRVGDFLIPRLKADETISLGLGQIEIRRAAELEEPERDFDVNPLTRAEINAYEKKLEDSEYNIDILSRELADNYQYYGKIDGKTEEDRWKFALAKHVSGHGPVGNAQTAAHNAGNDLNNWDDVSRFLDDEIVEFVDFVTSQPKAPPTMMA